MLSSNDPRPLTWPGPGSATPEAIELPTHAIDENVVVKFRAQSRTHYSGASDCLSKKRASCAGRWYGPPEALGGVPTDAGPIERDQFNIFTIYDVLGVEVP